MGHYSDFYASQKTEALLKQYGPKTLPELTEENLRYNIARANKAETELGNLKKALRVLKEAISYA